MLSPLFDSAEFLFEDGWEMTTTAALTNMAEFWEDVEAEAEGLAIDLPDNSDSDDWNLARAEPEEHKDKLVHHDCMWAGSCADSVHPENSFTFAETVVTVPGRSLLRKPASPPRPETPPSYDEEEPPQFRHAVDVADTALRLLRDSAAVAADHSYTLAKPVAKHKFENLGVQTPSDSEEEIDVVSLGEKTSTQPVRPETLPRSPSILERHHIQKTVASAITPRAHAQPGRKRVSRSTPPPPRKRTRGPGRRPRRTLPDTDSDADNPDYEKRSLHNDMERMRRVGLKNLFDQLKDQVPATRNKERAPKVVILREAASLCRRLQSEEREREALLRHQQRLMGRLRRLRTQLAPRYHSPLH